MKDVLRVFVAQDCSACIEAREIAARIGQDYAHLKVEIVDIADEQAVVPEAVFATPTYMLNNRLVSLGNPKPDEIARWANGGAIPPA
jgi:hypothetical protein